MDKTVRTLVIAFAVIGLGLLGYYWIGRWHTGGVESALQKERARCVERVAQLEAEIQRLNNELGPLAQEYKNDLAHAFGTEQDVGAVQGENVDCKKVTSQAVAFFQYLDSKAYAGDDARAEDLFEEVFKKLADNPPVNVGELDNLFNLTRNVTHLYRILGKERILQIKELLANEAAVVEPAISVLYNWVTICNAGEGGPTDPAKLKSLYQYACFFLNSLGGRSYLLRRESKLRMLINYYSLLVLDKANDAQFNAYGLDIRPHLDYLFYDINNQKGLLYRQRYLTQLVALRSKYQ
jgi:hypothetical protein